MPHVMPTASSCDLFRRSPIAGSGFYTQGRTRDTAASNATTGLGVGKLGGSPRTRPSAFGGPSVLLPWGEGQE